MSHSTEHPRNGETYHAYYFGFDGTGTPVDKVLKAVTRAGACYHHTEQWADDDGQICHMNQIQIAADEAAAEMIALRSLVGELVEGLALIEKLVEIKDRQAFAVGRRKTRFGIAIDKDEEALLYQALDIEAGGVTDRITILIARAKEAIK